MGNIIRSKLDRYSGHGYSAEIYGIKALCIISVIILHSLTRGTALSILAPFHIWLAVPVFMVVAGLSSTLSNRKRSSDTILEGLRHKLAYLFYRLILPYTLIWLCMVVINDDCHRYPLWLAANYITGGYGLGNYFIPVFVQHVCFFPLILWLKDRMDRKFDNQLITLLILFIVSILAEWLCIQLAIEPSLYRLLYIRYVFAAVIGSYLVTSKSVRHLIVIAPFSALYILLTCYFGLQASGIYPMWGPQHAPAYFYTAILVIGIWRLFSSSGIILSALIPIGKATYHIFLVQMLYFVIFPIKDIAVYTVINIIVCVGFGCVFWKGHQTISDIIRNLGPKEITFPLNENPKPTMNL